MGFFFLLSVLQALIRMYICFTTGIDQLITTGIVMAMVTDITGIIRSLHTTTVNRCRKRLDEAALKARGLIRKNDSGSGKPHEREEQYGITSVMKKRHGL
jgi:hypothetical protein